MVNRVRMLPTLTNRRMLFRMAFMVVLAFAAMVATTKSAFAHKGFIEICKFNDGKPQDGKDDDGTFKFSIWNKGTVVHDNIWVKVGTCTAPIPVSTDNGHEFTIREEQQEGFALTGIDVLPNDRLVALNLAEGKVTVNVPSAGSFGGKDYEDRTDETLVIFHNRKKDDGLLKICKFFDGNTVISHFEFDVKHDDKTEYVKVPVGKCILLPISFPKGKDVTVQERLTEGTEVKDIKVFSSDPYVYTSTADRYAKVKISDLITVIIIINKPPCKDACTYTIGGYSGPHAQQRITEAIGASGQIVIAGQTFLASEWQKLVTILKTEPSGGCKERQLARQLVAAKLNAARGACPTEEQEKAISDAEELLAPVFTKNGVPDSACKTLDVGNLTDLLTDFNESENCK